MIDPSYPLPFEFAVETVVADVTTLFEQYEAVNDAEPPPADDLCENLYAVPQ